MPKVLETHRLILRDLTIDDIDHLLDLFSDPKAMRYLPGTKDRRETEKWLSRVFESYRNLRFGPWAVILKDSEAFLGYCGLYSQKNVGGRDEIEILYGLIRRHWGKGYATEAANGTYAYGKTALKLNRFISLIAPGNDHSTRVVRKIGMVFEKDIMMWGRPYHLYAIGRGPETI